MCQSTRCVYIVIRRESIFAESELFMLRIVKYTNVGSRDENEDAHEIFYEYFQDRNRLCAVVADGLGGHGGGSEASQTAVKYIGKMFLEQKDSFLDKISENMEVLNSLICDKQTKQMEMRTTIAVLIIEGENITTAHMGDTRIYHFVDNKIVAMTFDHSVSQLAVLAGEICQEDVRYHVDRNKLLRTLGKKEGVKVEINSWGNIKGKRHAFLLCTDGFWEKINEREMTECLKVSDGPKEWMTQMTNVLNARIDSKTDNNTAIAVWSE